MTETLTDRDHLYAAILREPGDDTVRLVYADELDVSGDELDCDRAAYVRHAVTGGAGPFAFPAGEAASVLLPPTAEKLRAPNRRLEIAPATPGVAWTVHRGFVSEVRLTAATLVGGPCVRCCGLKRGDLVVPIPPNALACGSGLYPAAVVVSVDPFALVSEAGDMLWTATQTPDVVRRVGIPGDPSSAYRRYDRERLRAEGCPDCSGTGRAPGDAAALARLPLEAVTLSDREPTADATGVWFWYKQSSSGRGDGEWPDTVPDDVFALLAPPPGEVMAEYGTDVKDFRTPALAHAALSDVCLRYVWSFR